MQANAGETRKAHCDGASVHYTRHRPEQTRCTDWCRSPPRVSSFKLRQPLASLTSAHLVDNVIPRVPLRQWVLSLPIPLRMLLAAQPVLVTPVVQVVQRVIMRHLLDQTGLKIFEADSGAVTLTRRFGSAANLNIHLHCLALDGVYPQWVGFGSHRTEHPLSDINRHSS